MRMSTIRAVLFALLVALVVPLTAAADDQPATPVAVTEVPTSTPIATETASTPVAGEPVATEEPVTAANSPVTLTFNGVADSIFVKVGTTVTVDASPSGMWFFVYHGSGCQGDRFDFMKESWPLTLNETGVVSVMAFDPEVDYMHPTGPCQDITWAAPTLLLNGAPRDAFLTLNSQLRATTVPISMKINIYGGSGCQAERLIAVATTGYQVQQPEAGTASLQAFDPADPSNVSPCLEATWDSFTPPAQPVELLLNGKKESITVFNNHVVTMETSPGNLLLKIYDGPDCVGRPVVRRAQFNQIMATDTTQSAQAFDPDHPANPSACLNIVWRTPVITVTVNSWYPDHQAYYPGFPFEVSYTSEDSAVTVLGRLYLGPYCGKFPEQTTVVELPAATQPMHIQDILRDSPSIWIGHWSLEGYDPQSGTVSRCVDIHQAQRIGEQPATPEVPVTAGPTDPTSTTSAAAVTALPNTGDGPADTRSTAETLLAVSLVLGAMLGVLSLTRIQRGRFRIAPDKTTRGPDETAPGA